jgi:hypothetical protein
MARPQAFSSFVFARRLRLGKTAQPSYPFENTVALIG